MNQDLLMVLTEDLNCVYTSNCTECPQFQTLYRALIGMHTVDMHFRIRTHTIATRTPVRRKPCFLL